MTPRFARYRAALAAAALLIAGPAVAQQGQPAAELTAPELNVLLGAAWGAQEKIELSRLGQQSGNEQVRAYAQMLVREHEQALGQLRQIAQTLRVELPPPPSSTSSRQVNDRLKQLEGHEFDEQFMQLQYETHRVALAGHANAPEVVENEAIDQYARTYAPKIVAHLQDAQNILQMLEKQQGATASR